ncbi:MAG: sigma-70 family RNA polymerase sigma factor, partial [Acidimicrobiia bacterium]
MRESPDPGVGEVEGGVVGSRKEDGVVYAEHAPLLIRLATVVVGPDDAADVVSAAVVRALASPRWPAVRNPGAYLVRSVQNEARRKLRADTTRRAREQRVDRREEQVNDAIEPEIMAAVRQLSRRQQAVVLLTYWDDMKAADVATALGISEGSVKRH